MWGLILCWILIFWASVEGEAKIRHGVCADCHTMHNSQGGVVVANGTLWGAGPIPALLNDDCIGCHTGENTENNPIPYVLSPNPPQYDDPSLNGFGTDGNTLAGGNFYWVKAGEDNKGHNVEGIAGQDASLGFTPPGGTSMEQQLRCAGTYGCHGDPAIAEEIRALHGAHHTDDSVIDGATVGTSYRFLLGVQGYEDTDWEFTVSSSDHNQYKGRDRTSETELDSSTISGFCARCHGDFHYGTDVSGNDAGFGSPWLRHPVDYDLGNKPSTSEYRDYPGALSVVNSAYTNGTYAPEVPLGSEDVSAPKATLNFNNDAIITCLTCHRAHGTPYPKLLRWDYWGWPGNGRVNGCNACHTTKQ